MNEAPRIARMNTDKSQISDLRFETGAEGRARLVDHFAAALYWSDWDPTPTQTALKLVMRLAGEAEKGHAWVPKPDLLKLLRAKRQQLLQAIADCRKEGVVLVRDISDDPMIGEVCLNCDLGTWIGLQFQPLLRFEGGLYSNTVGPSAAAVARAEGPSQIRGITSPREEQAKSSPVTHREPVIAPSSSGGLAAQLNRASPSNFDARAHCAAFRDWLDGKGPEPPELDAAAAARQPAAAAADENRSLLIESISTIKSIDRSREGCALEERLRRFLVEEALRPHEANPTSSEWLGGAQFIGWASLLQDHPGHVAAQLKRVRDMKAKGVGRSNWAATLRVYILTAAGLRAPVGAIPTAQ